MLKKVVCRDVDAAPVAVTVDANGNAVATPVSDGDKGSAPAPVKEPLVVNPADADNIEPALDDSTPTGGAPAVKPPGKDNAAFASMRVENTQLKGTVNELKEHLNSITSALQNIGNPNGSTDGVSGEPIEKRLVADPIGTIQEIAVKVYGEQNSRKDFQDVLTISRKTVLEKYPALKDGNSKEYQLYNQICATNPDYFKLAKGPLFAMREMEEVMATGADATPANADATPNTDAIPTGGNAMLDPNRGARVNSGIIMKGGAAGGNINPAQELSVAQLTYCKQHQIDPKVYKQIVNKETNRGYTA